MKIESTRTNFQKKKEIYKKKIKNKYKEKYTKKYFLWNIYLITLINLYIYILSIYLEKALVYNDVVLRPLICS